MKFKFEALKGSIYSSETVILEGDYLGPSKIDVNYDDEGNIGIGENIITLESKNPDHIVLMDILDGSRWDQTEKDIFTETADNGLVYNIYRKDTPAENYDINGSKIINGEIKLKLIQGDRSKEETIEEIKEAMDSADHIFMHSLDKNKKSKAKYEYEYFDKMLNDAPRGVDIRDIAFPV